MGSPPEEKDSVGLPQYEVLHYSDSVREAQQAIQASSKIAPNASQNIAVNAAGSSASNAIASVAVIIPITAHSPPRAPNTQASIPI